MRRQIASLLSCLLVALAVASGCSDPAGPAPSTNNATNNANNVNNLDPDASDVDTDAAEDVSDTPDVEADVVEDTTVVCEPNAIIRCVIENSKAIEKCNFRGNDIFQAECDGTAVCRDAVCVPVTCIPGLRFCQDDLTPVRCNDDGSAYEPQPTCEEGAICSEGSCLDPCDVAEQSRSYIGCDYWPVELDNHLLFDEDETSTPDAPFAVVIANPGADPARVTVFAPDGSVHVAIPEIYIPVGLVDPRFTSTTVYTEVIDITGNRVGDPVEGEMSGVVVPPGGQLQVLFPRNEPPPFETSLTRIAWHIQSNRPVVAYQFNPICCNYSFTNDASILLPKGALTENYVALTYPTWNPSTTTSYPSTLTIVAIEDDTQVEVRLRDPRIRPSMQGVVPDADGVLTVTMNAQEVLNIESAADVPEVDLTGSVVAASKPVAVYGGHTCTNIPISLSACDHVEQQLFPSETWGQNYVAAPLKLRGDGRRTREGTYWKILARRDGTEVVFDQPFNDLSPLRQSAAGVPYCGDKLIRNDTLLLNANEFCEFGTQTGYAVNATQPILYGAFMSGQESTGNLQFGNQAGDPAFFLLPPQEQFRTDYAFLTPATYALDYATVIVPNGSSLTLDGRRLVFDDYEYDLIPSQNYLRVHIPLADGPHTIVGDSPFGLIVYAYDDFVSYAFTGGLNLAKLSEEGDR